MAEKNNLKKILITGASGLLGRSIFKILKSETANVIGLCYSRPTSELIKVDITNEKALEDSLLHIKPNIIIHCAAERNPDKCQNQQDLTQQLNVTATENIAKLANRLNSYLIYISTDYVFDGSLPPYYPDSTPNPLNIYGASKLAGEKAILQHSNNVMILRVPVLYGETNDPNESAVTTIYNVVKNPKQVVLDHYATRFPTFTSDIADTINQIFKLPKDSYPKGIYHYSNPEAKSKYEMAIDIAKIFNLKTDHLIADDKEPKGAPRPKNCQLDVSKLTKLIPPNYTPFLVGIKQVLSKFEIK